MIEGQHMKSLQNSKDSFVAEGTVFLLLLLSCTIISGCIPVFYIKNPLPKDCHEQLELHLNHDGINMAWIFYSAPGEKWGQVAKLVSTSPFVTSYPFNEINDKIRNYEAMLKGIVIGVGTFRYAEFIVLLEESGRLVAIMLDKTSAGGIYDLKFYESVLSAKWKDEILKMHEQGAMVARIDSWFYVSSVLAYSRDWETQLLDDEYDKDSFVKFMAKVKTAEEPQPWTKFWRIRNRVATSADFKQLKERFPEKQFLIVEEKLIFDKEIKRDWPRVIINNTVLPGHTSGKEYEILRFLSKGNYSAIIYLPLHDWYDDLERTQTAQQLRKIAAKKHLPFFVASPREYEDNDIVIPGVPPKIRIYME